MTKRDWGREKKGKSIREEEEGTDNDGSLTVGWGWLTHREGAWGWWCHMRRTERLGGRIHRESEGI